MATPVLDKNQFYRRINKIYDFWKNAEPEEPIAKCDVFVLAVGGSDETTYSKSTTTQTWLFGVELPDLVMVVGENVVTFLSSKKKIDFLQPLTSSPPSGSPAISLIVRDKGDDNPGIAKAIAAVKTSKKGKVIGCFAKDTFDGTFFKAWKDAVKSAAFEQVDVTASFAKLLAPKDDSEMNLIRQACQASCDIYTKFVKAHLVDMMESDKKVKHSKLSAQIDEAASNKKFLPPGLNNDNAETCFPPIVQSGGSYNLKFSAESDDKLIVFDNIITLFGIRYSSYCSSIGRTMLIDPHPTMVSNYELAIKVEDEIISKLRDGAVLGEVHAAAVNLVRAEQPDLVDKLMKQLGFVTGIEFREGTMTITAGSKAVVRANMVFVVAVGFQDLPLPGKEGSSKTYSLLISDTVSVPSDSSSPAVYLTDKVKRTAKSCVVQIKDDGASNEESGSRPNSAANNAESDLLLSNRMRGRGAVLDSKTRGEQGNNQDDKRAERQRELFERLQEETKEILRGLRAGAGDKRATKSNVSYKNRAQMPGQEPDFKDLRLYVDRKYETLILPINGSPVPFHVSTIKNLSISVEGDYTYLRINFFFPGANIVKTEGLPYPEGAEALQFIKEVNFRASNQRPPGETAIPANNLNTAYRLMKEVQKKFKTREQEEREKEGVVSQGALIEAERGFPRLKDLYIRPPLSQKRMQGVLEAHVNGFRFRIGNDRVDILYSNVKNAFFQPCDHELIILIHLHLKNPILFGKKKQQDVQFYHEVGEMMTDLGKRKNLADRDEIEEEQREREMRQQIKAAFKVFIDRVEQVTKNSIEFDIPYRDLGFMGSPYRSTCLLQPTSGCLVQLTEWPPFVVALDEVAFVHFERVSFQLKNFDMVVVFKDFHKKPHMVSSIPAQQLDAIKEWLNSCDLVYTEGIQSLNWSKIMKTVADDPEGFIELGGWNFLVPDSEEEEEKGSDAAGSSEDDEEYRPSDEAGSSASEEEEEEEEDDDDDDSEEWDEDESASESGSSSASESGKSWSELEEEAKRDDAARGCYSDDEDEEKKRKQAALGKKPAPPAGAKKPPPPPSQPTKRFAPPPSKGASAAKISRR